MAVTYRSSSSANTGSTQASSLAVNMPAGAVAGDVIIACVGTSNGSGVSVNALAGWKTLISITGSSNMTLIAFWHLVTGYEPASYTFTFTSSCQASAVFMDYSGAYQYQPRSFSSNSTGTSSTASMQATVGASYSSGMALQFIGAMNTSASSTMAPGGSFTQHVDTCTTASQFVEVCGQDIAYSGVLTGGTSNPATISQSATSTALGVFLEAPRPPFFSLAQDETFAAGWSTAATTFTNPVYAPFITHFYNELVLVFVTIRNGSTTVSGITGNGYTWVNVGRANTNAGGVEVWRTLAPTPASFTITGTLSASTTAGDFTMVGIVGADLTGTNGSGAIGALSTGSSTSAAPTISITSTRNNSWIWGLSNDPGSATSYNAGGSNTIIRAVKDTTNGGTNALSQQNALTTTSGTNVTVNFTTPSTDSCNILALEILPALQHNLGALGAG